MVNKDINWHLTEATRLLAISQMGARPPAKKLIGKVLLEHLPAIREYINDKKWQQAIQKADDKGNTFTR